jgi:hypothetical protein
MVKRGLFGEVERITYVSEKLRPGIFSAAVVEHYARYGLFHKQPTLWSVIYETSQKE